MSFLIDPPWLYATGRLYGRVMPERTPVARALHTATAATFLVTSISLYTNRRWTKPISDACRAEDGRDWMLNSGVFRFDHKHASRRVHLVSALLFLTYPWWLWLGERVSRAKAQPAATPDLGPYASSAGNGTAPAAAQAAAAA
jgi:hypothetical protein